MQRTRRLTLLLLAIILTLSLAAAPEPPLPEPPPQAPGRAASRLPEGAQRLSFHVPFPPFKNFGILGD